jgi:hypothetical protein
MRKTVHEWLDGHKHDKRSPKKKLPGQKRSKRPPAPQRPQIFSQRKDQATSHFSTAAN